MPSEYFIRRFVSGADNGIHAGAGEGEGGGDDRAQLRAHGYEVEPEVIVDASGGEWGPLFKVPAALIFFAMLTPNPRSRIISSLCIDPWT